MIDILNIQKTIQNFKNKHPKPSNDYEKWFIKWLDEAIEIINLCLYKDIELELED